jgi:hypothetical protein
LGKAVVDAAFRGLCILRWTAMDIQGVLRGDVWSDVHWNSASDLAMTAQQASQVSWMLYHLRKGLTWANR